MAAPPRVTNGLLVLYTFAEAQGTVVNDVSGVSGLNLTITDPNAASWMPGALTIIVPTSLVYANGPATPLADALMASNEITVEAWIWPANWTQAGPARIVSLSMDTNNRNFTLGQGLFDNQPSDVFNMRLRTTATDPNGEPSLSTTELVPGPDVPPTTELMHVLYTRDISGTARFYINGVEAGSAAVGGDFSNWDNTFALTLANEVTGDRPWLGEFHLVAIYNRALTPEEVTQNFDAGADMELLIP